MEVLYGMKLTNVAFVVAIVFLCFMIIDDVKTGELWAITIQQSKLNNVLDNAVEDAMIRFVETDSVRDIVINKEEAVNQFFTSVFINMDIMENPALKRQFSLYVPTIAVVEEDGFYLYYTNEETVQGEKHINQIFTQKYNYTQTYDNYKISYTLGDYIYVSNVSTGQLMEGNYHDIREQCYISHLMDDQIFEEERRKVIINLLKERMTFFINHHNRIAKFYGIQYEFTLPQIEKEEWYRTIDDIGMIVFFQGYPYGGRERGFYNRVLIGGARVRKDT